jgi:long-chain acyl-CoA synthetase
MVPDLS